MNWLYNSVPSDDINKMKSISSSDININTKNTEIKSIKEQKLKLNDIFMLPENKGKKLTFK